SGACLKPSSQRTKGFVNCRLSRSFTDAQNTTSPRSKRLGTGPDSENYNKHSTSVSGYGRPSIASSALALTAFCCATTAIPKPWPKQKSSSGRCRGKNGNG